MIKLHTGFKDCVHCKDRKINCLEVLMGRMKENPLTEEMQTNLEGLLVAVNKFRAKYGKPLTISSGYRPAAQNVLAGGAKKSSHLMCQAVDFNDKSKTLKDWVKSNPSILEECDLYAEAFEYTGTWLHVQTRKTVSGKRIFIP
jgi:uncharacterized protein YcbK (DUF882 family)